MNVMMLHFNNSYSAAMKIPYSRRRRSVTMWEESESRNKNSGGKSKKGRK